MPEFIEKKDVTRDGISQFLSTVLLRCITQKHGKGNRITLGLEDLVKDDKPLEVCLTINGVEVPFVETILSMEKGIERDVLKRGEELVEEKLADAFYNLDDIRTEVERLFKARLGVELED